MRIEKNAKEAELLVQVGDIDNLGFGWPDEFDPFSGKSTPIHAFPWKPEADDPPGTDRIMVNSGAQTVLRSKDGYTRDTDRPDNSPQPITIQFDPAAVPIKGALLQLFVDDFQAPVMKTRFSVTLDGRPAPDIETTINKLNQTGPVGKLITIKLLPEYLGLLGDGKLQILVDDATSNIGDGYAFDFARLLINPKGFVYAGTIRGIVIDKDSDAPIDGALASAGNVRQATTNVDGHFELKDVPAGLVVVTGSHPDYVTGSEQTDLLAGETVDLTIRLERAKNETLADRLESDGKVDLYGIYFDTDKAVLKAESEATLQQVLQLLKAKPALRIAIAGHTDAQASDTYNADLSKRRAQAVMAWLTTRGIVASRLTAQGFGESQPVADNSSAAGRALNRRVEIRDLSR
jgi:outer membrane protein OmpA-like peptidoglycan-associated protein